MAAARVELLERDGGSEPVWARSGRELFYRNGKGDLVAVQVETSPTFLVRRQEVLFSAARYRGNSFSTVYDVSADGQRFLMIDQRAPEVASELTLVVNWFDELRRLVPR